jgi:hypothetical protein
VLLCSAPAAALSAVDDLVTRMFHEPGQAPPGEYPSAAMPQAH